MPGVTELLSPRTLMWVLAASLLANAFLVYRLFDTALSLDHARSETAALRARATQSLAVIRHMSSRTSRDEVAALAAELAKQGIVVKVQATEIQTGDVVFKFSGERLGSVAYLE